VKVPYPSENLTSSIDAQEKEAMQKVQQFIAESNKRIATYQANIAKWDKVLAFEDMTLEDYRDAFPEDAYDIHRPTLWPHTPEDQPGYVPPPVAGGPTSPMTGGH